MILVRERTKISAFDRARKRTEVAPPIHAVAPLPKRTLVFTRRYAVNKSRPTLAITSRPLGPEST